jgi:hypothetical protein
MEVKRNKVSGEKCKSLEVVKLSEDPEMTGHLL